MTPDEATEKLLIHAGYDESSVKDDCALATVLWKARRGLSCQDIDIAVKDVIQCLAVINDSLNCEEVVKQAATTFPRRLTGAIAQICSDLIETAIWMAPNGSRQQLMLPAWLVSCAWCAVVAGDIADLEMHVALEAKARFDRDV